MFQSNTRSKLLTLMGAAMMLLVMLVPSAQAKEPAAGYTQFAGCPTRTESPPTSSCFRSEITGGHVIMGKKEVPIEKPFEISGGLTENGQNSGATAKGGLTPVAQKVPGGVIGLTGLTWLLEFFGSEALTLYATTELAGIPSSPLNEPIFLPVKVHLTNPAGLLGSKCYIGSVTEPIKFNLITGTTKPPPPNKPITGKFPEFEFDEVHEIAKQKNGVFVDNSFAAPGANGCVLTLFGFIPISINGLVNTQSGLPSPAGTNELIQNFNAELVDVRLVYPPNGF